MRNLDDSILQILEIHYRVKTGTRKRSWCRRVFYKYNPKCSGLLCTGEGHCYIKEKYCSVWATGVSIIRCKAMEREKYHVCILIVRFQPLVYRPLCAGEQPVFSRAQRCLYHANLCNIRYVMVFYLCDQCEFSQLYICRIRAIWLILLTIVDYWWSKREYSAP